MMADQTLFASAHGEEDHVSPSAGGGAWMLVALGDPTLKMFR